MCKLPQPLQEQHLEKPAFRCDHIPEGLNIWNQTTYKIPSQNLRPIEQESFLGEPLLYQISQALSTKIYTPVPPN